MLYEKSPVKRSTILALFTDWKAWLSGWVGPPLNGFGAGAGGAFSGFSAMRGDASATGTAAGTLGALRAKVAGGGALRTPNA
ncbi:hypothetical protein [Chitinophaga caseinilytica]|uniref:Uncharacterized protein n=1 Tax=Chitinophaga caseinilytica TaxID=2267521 RepID=A0ABZ2Z3F0_9BACT